MPAYKPLITLRFQRLVFGVLRVNQLNKLLNLFLIYHIQNNQKKHNARNYHRKNYVSKFVRFYSQENPIHQKAE
jgi:translation initiation factor 2 alpha subunit (eIF-2alpha)